MLNRRLKVKAKKHLGQHFLTDLSIAADIAATLSHAPTANVLEVGPGMGVLTQFLMKNGHEVRVAEIDSESVEYLRMNFPGLHGRIIEGDFLRMDLRDVFAGQEFSLIGNYPYNISSQIMFKALEYTDIIPVISGMFQKEVAERLTAEHGSKTYAEGLLRHRVSLYCTGKRFFSASESKIRRDTVGKEKGTGDRFRCLYAEKNSQGRFQPAA